MEAITAKELTAKLKDYQKKCVILDVRNPEEFDEEKIEGAINIPLGDLKDHLKDLKKDKEIILICLSGMRAQRAANILEANGYKCRILTQGMIGWRKEHPPVYQEMEGGEE